MALPHPLNLFSGAVDTTSVYTTDPSTYVDSAISRARKEAEAHYNARTTDGGDRDFPIPHHLTFASVWNWHQKYYYTYYDESQIDSIANSIAMRHDGFVQELLWHRQLPTISTQFSLECDDPDDPGQVQIRKDLDRIVRRVPYMKRLQLQLLEALFYGRSGVQLAWGKKKIAGREVTTVTKHLPVNGDKIAYDWDGTPGVFIYKGSQIFNDPVMAQYVKPLDRGPAFFLRDNDYKDHFIIHEFQPTDTDYLFESDKAAAVHGLGFRDRFYWAWNMRAQVLDWYMNAIERVGANGMLFGYFQSGNVQAKNAVINALKDLIEHNVAAFPRMMGDNTSMIDRIDPSQVGYDVMYILLNHFEEIMRRGFLGQNLSSKSSATGLGSNLADLQGESKEDTIIFDSDCLAETLNEQLIQKIIKFNKWEYRGKIYHGEDLPFDIRYVVGTERRNVSEIIAAAEACWRMGIPLDMDDIREKAGLTPPRSKATTLVQMGGMTGMTPNADAVESDAGPGTMNGLDDGEPGGYQFNPDGPQNGKIEPESYIKTATELDVIGKGVATPTTAQKEAGNYKKAHVRIHGLPITIETPRGRTRSGTSPDGKKWSTVMAHHYGYIKRTESEADGDHIDVFIGRHPESDSVYVINQVDPKTGLFDEHKCMIGFLNMKRAKKGYLACYEPGWKGMGSIVSMTMDQFKEWVTTGTTKGPIGGRGFPEHYAFNEQDHPRSGKGNSDGGRFVSRGSSSMPGYLPRNHPGEKKTANSIAEMIDRNTSGHIDVQNLKRILNSYSPYFGLVSIDPRSLSRHEDSDVDPSLASVSKGPIVAGPDMAIIDGRHRVAAAIKRGDSKINVYLPINMGGEHYEFREQDHPRGGKGTHEGGQFVAKGQATHPTEGKPTPSPLGGSGESAAPQTPKKGGRRTRVRKKIAPIVRQRRFGRVNVEKDLSKDEENELKDIAKNILGPKGDIDTLVSLAGSPEGSNVNFYLKSANSVVITSRLWRKDEHGEPVEAILSERTIHGDGKRKYIHNDYFRVHDDFQGQGLGLEVFGREVEEAIDQGFSHIETYAAKGDDFNGYYTWPRFGYDADLDWQQSDQLQQDIEDGNLSEEFLSASRISDLMVNEEGRQWWKANGTSMDMVFDLKPGSLSRQVWDAYLKERDARAQSEATAPTSQQETKTSSTQSGNGSGQQEKASYEPRHYPPVTDEDKAFDLVYDVGNPDDDAHKRFFKDENLRMTVSKAIEDFREELGDKLVGRVQDMFAELARRKEGSAETYSIGSHQWTQEDERKHPRVKKGSPESGRFTESDKTAGTPSATATAPVATHAKAATTQKGGAKAKAKPQTRGDKLRQKMGKKKPETTPHHMKPAKKGDYHARDESETHLTPAEHAEVQAAMAGLEGEKKSHSYIKSLVEKIGDAPLISEKAAVEIIKSEIPQHLEYVEKFMDSRLNRVKQGQVTTRDVAKALMITIASQGAREINFNTIKNALGKDSEYVRWLEDTDEGRYFSEVATDEGKKGSRVIRGEEAAAGWFMSPAGRRALDNLDNGQFDKNDWVELFKVRKAWGDDRFGTFNVLGAELSVPESHPDFGRDDVPQWDYAGGLGRGKAKVDKKTGKQKVGKAQVTNANLRDAILVDRNTGKSKNLQLKDVGKIVDMINESKGDPEVIDKSFRMLTGIGNGKIGFIKHMFGFSHESTVDAVQVNFWLTGQGDIRRNKSEEARFAEEIKRNFNNPHVSAAITNRVQKQMGKLSEYLEKHYGQKVSQHILHHWLWEAAKQSVVTHAGMYMSLGLHESEESPEFFGKFLTGLIAAMI